MQKIRRFLRQHDSIVRFGVVGVGSLAVDYGLLLVQFRLLHVPLAVATTIAYFIGLLVNFSLNKVWTFNAPSGIKHSTRQAVQYAILVLVNVLSINAIIVGLAEVSFPPEITKLIATAVLMTFNYFVYKQVIFKG
jgi:putative flippase GtrA